INGCHAGGIGNNGKFLRFVYEDLEIMRPVGIADEVNAAAELFISPECAFAAVVQLHRVNDGQLLAIIMAQVNILVPERLERYLDLVTVLAKANGRAQRKKDDG